MFGTWADTPRRLVASFVLLLLLPAAAVVWLGLQLLAQDRELSTRQMRERRQMAAERVAGELEKAVSAIERQLAGTDPQTRIVSGDDAVVVKLTLQESEAFPSEHLLYHPETPRREPEGGLEFAAAEALEFRDVDFDGAARAYRDLSVRAASPEVTAKALLGQARALRQTGRALEALGVYEQLGQLSDVHVLDLPAELVARRARALTLADLGKRDDLAAAAESLKRDLLKPRWRIGRGTFDAYMKEVGEWLGRTDEPVSERETLSAAVAWLWRERQRTAVAQFGRHSLRLHDRDVTVIWQTSDERLSALVAGPRFRQREFIDPVRAKLDQPATIQLETPGRQWQSNNTPDARVLHLSSAETGLPWNVAVNMDEDELERGRLISRRRTLGAGVALLFVVVAAGVYVTARSMAHELAIARLQSDFVSAVSHEFRTPLTALKQFTALLAEDDALPVAKRRTFYQAQARATDRLTHLVESLLDFGRMEAGAHPYRMAALRIDAVVSDLVSEFRPDAAADGFSVECTVADDCGWIVGDRDALDRALRNLLENAIKYSDTGRRVAVHVGRRNNTVAISVRDEGLGIPRHEQREVFKKFVRGSLSRTHGIKGTGIGLAMVRHIVGAHRGRVTLESEPGRGSTFTIWLPAAVSDAIRDNETVTSQP